MKNVSIVWIEDDKLLNNRHFVVNKTEIVQHVLKNSVKFLVS